ncbi:MAG TPA: hypothetical protein P5148_07765, partial [Anaerolineae bacterium]|nr:hypothetical protein [Anaerolineae bacterium]
MMRHCIVSAWVPGSGPTAGTRIIRFRGRMVKSAPDKLRSRAPFVRFQRIKELMETCYTKGGCNWSC